MTLYELLTLQPSVPGADRQEILRRMIEDDPVPIRRLSPAVPVDLATVVAKAICKDPAGRYETGAAPRRRPEAVPGGPADRGPADRRSSRRRWCRRRPLPAGLALGLVAAVAVGFVGVAWSWREAVHRRDLMARARREAG